MSSVKYNLDSLAVLRALQAILAIEVGNLGYRLSVLGIYTLNGMLLTTQMSLMALAEIGLLIVIWAMKPGWRVIINSYTVFMTSVELVWIMSLAIDMPWYFGSILFFFMLILFRAVALIRLNYNESKMISQ
jgi:hypothetical protein